MGVGMLQPTTDRIGYLSAAIGNPCLSDCLLTIRDAKKH